MEANITMAWHVLRSQHELIKAAMEEPCDGSIRVEK